MSNPVSGDGPSQGRWVPAARSGAYSWVAPGRASDRADLSPMPARLRDLIADQARGDAAAALPAPESANDEGLVPGLVERISARIVKSAPFALLAQANHTRQSVRALLTDPQDP